MLATSTKKRLLQTLIALQQNELDKHFEHLAQDQIVRSRAKWAELGEKNTKYFLNLEKHHATKKAVFSCKVRMVLLLTKKKF